MESFPEILRAASWSDSPAVGITLLVLFVVLIVAMHFVGSFHTETIHYFFQNKQRVSYADADGDNAMVATLLLTVFSVVSYGLFLALAYNYRCQLPFVPMRSAWLPFIFTAVVLAWMLVQWLLLKLAGYCADKSREMQQLIRAFFAVFIMVGLIIFPVVVGMVYAPQNVFVVLFYIGFAAMGIGGVLLTIKCLQLFFSGIGTVCYLILYLCTLEILPILLLGNVVKSLMANVLN